MCQIGKLVSHQNVCVKKPELQMYNIEKPSSARKTTKRKVSQKQISQNPVEQASLCRQQARIRSTQRRLDKCQIQRCKPIKSFKTNCISKQRVARYIGKRTSTRQISETLQKYVRIACKSPLERLVFPYASKIWQYFV